MPITTLTKLLSRLLFVAHVVVPLLATLIWLGVLYDPGWPSALRSTFQFVIWLYFVPVVAVYSGIAFLRYLPGHPRQLAIMFSPLVISAASAIWWRPTVAQLPQQLFAQAAPYILGLALIMIIGVAVLGVAKASAISATHRQTALRLFVFSLIAIPWIWSVYMVFTTGRAAWITLTPQVSPTVATGLFLVNIVVIVVTYIPKFRELYHEGRL